MAMAPVFINQGAVTAPTANAVCVLTSSSIPGRYELVPTVATIDPVSGAFSGGTYNPTTIVTTGSITSGTTLTAGTGIVSTTGNIVASAGNVSATLGSVTAGTTLTATLGNITATNGNLVLTTAGNKMIRTSVGSGAAAGANSIGTATLIAGTLTISTTAITSSSLVRIWRQSVGATGAAALGVLSLGTIVNGVSFVVNAWQPADATALAVTDVSVIGYEIIN